MGLTVGLLLGSAEGRALMALVGFRLGRGLDGDKEGRAVGLGVAGARVVVGLLLIDTAVGRRDAEAEGGDVAEGQEPYAGWQPDPQ